jgi:hypothetical protein
VWEEEYSTGIDNWDRKRRTMISKVAESQCLRKAFSISGIYAPEETGEDGHQGPDIQVVETVAATQSVPTVEISDDEGAKQLKFLRGELNQALLKCEDEKGFRDVRAKFQRTHTKAIWERATGHKEGETFQSLSEQHWERVKGANAAEAWAKKMEACPDIATFKILEEEYCTNILTNSPDNATLINTKGEEFGLPEYLSAQKGA